MDFLRNLEANLRLPRWALVRQRLEETEVTDVAAAVARELERPYTGELIRPGARVAIGVGSRGIDRLLEVVKALVTEVKKRGGEPFIVPAMGSHGGATASGQREVLASYGLTEETLGCSIRSSMDVVKIGEAECDLSPSGSLTVVPVYQDRLTRETADLIIPVNRIKPHTDFHGPVESGLLKMLVIGFGKQKGAETVHALGFELFPPLLPCLGRYIIEHSPVAFGLALVENGHGRLGYLEAVPAEEITKREPQLLQRAREWLPRLPLSSIDLLIVDYIGKDVSGLGMDSNVIGRYYNGPLRGGLKAGRIYVRALTPATEGNAVGLGLADVALERAYQKMDREKTWANVITAKTPEGARIPVLARNDREGLALALAACVGLDPQRPRIVRIRDTKHLEYFWASEALLEELRANPAITGVGPLQPITLDQAGMLPEWSAEWN